MCAYEATYSGKLELAVKRLKPEERAMLLVYQGNATIRDMRTDLIDASRSYRDPSPTLSLRAEAQPALEGRSRHKLEGPAV